MNKKRKYQEMFIGFAVGIIANILGVLLYILIFSDMGIAETYQAAVEQGHVGSLLALGAIAMGFLGIRTLVRALFSGDKPSG